MATQSRIRLFMSNIEYNAFLRQLGQVNSERILRAAAEAKTRSQYVQNYSSLEVEAAAASTLAAFSAALEAYNANRLIGDSLK